MRATRHSPFETSVLAVPRAQRPNRIGEQHEKTEAKLGLDGVDRIACCTGILEKSVALLVRLRVHIDPPPANGATYARIAAMRLLRAMTNSLLFAKLARLPRDSSGSVDDAALRALGLPVPEDVLDQVLHDHGAKEGFQE